MNLHYYPDPNRIYTCTCILTSYMKKTITVYFQIFSICAFATICGYNGYIKFACDKDAKIDISYPFILIDTAKLNVGNASCTATVGNDFASDARFFVATGVLSMLFSLGIIFLYAKMDEAYKTNKKLPLYVSSLYKYTYRTLYYLQLMG